MVTVYCSEWLLNRGGLLSEVGGALELNLVAKTLGLAPLAGGLPNQGGC